MIPYKDESASRRFPIMTVLLIVANFVVFLYQGNLPKEVAFIYGAVPAHIVNGKNLGLPMLEPAWLTIFTSMFLHGSWLHLLGNMLYLWIFGDNVEDLFGSFRFLIFYLLCGVAAAGLQIWMSLGTKAADFPMVGASGAIAGVLGAYFIKFPTARIRTLIFFIFSVVSLPAFVLLGFWFLLQFFNAMLATGQAGGVAFFAHVGGFIAGIFLVVPFAAGRKRAARI